MLPYLHSIHKLKRIAKDIKTILSPCRIKGKLKNGQRAKNINGQFTHIHNTDNQLFNQMFGSSKHIVISRKVENSLLSIKHHFFLG